ncbi:MAG: triose-phosphate isomerase [Candidatus Omnitrophica bacterium]|nr:triose-phosphate isomerase [Candidatus Omnitrophota bacterium]
MRRLIIAGNWKMNKTVAEAIDMANGLNRNFPDDPGLDIVVCPAYTALSETGNILQDSVIGLGAQDMYWQDSGAFTGEISPLMLKELGVKFVVLGHSERRQFFGETNESVNKKVKAAVKHGFIPIMCVGEKLEERKSGKTFDVIKEHIELGLEGLMIEAPENIVIAYEPVWAIGTGVNATPIQAQEAHFYIRKLLTKTFDSIFAQSIRIQYGGSVKSENMEELMNQEDVDGALVGGASLDLNSFTEIIKKAQKVVTGK